LSRYVERSRVYGAQNLPIPGTSLKFSTVPQETIPTSIPVRFPSQNLIYKWYQIPAGGSPQVMGVLPTSLETNIQACLGTVNSLPFDMAYANYQPGYLLYLQPRLHFYTAYDGSIYCDIEHLFIFRQYPHNWFLKRALFAGGNTVVFELATHDGTQTGRAAYLTADHNLLFKVA
jgi:hypothetical protein